MQTWDLQKRNRVRTGERGMLPITLPGAGVYRCRDGYVVLFILAPGGADFPVLVDWMRERGMAADLDEEPYASMCNSLNMAVITQIMSDPSRAVGMMPVLAHLQEVVVSFCASLGANEAYEEGQKRRLLVGLASTPQDLGANRQLRARNWFVRLDFDHLGSELEFPGGPYRLSETPAQVARPPRLGEHTAAILAALS